MSLSNVAINSDLHARVKFAASVLPDMDIRKATTEACEDWLDKNASQIKSRTKELAGLSNVKASNNKATKTQ